MPVGKEYTEQSIHVTTENFISIIKQCFKAMRNFPFILALTRNFQWPLLSSICMNVILQCTVPSVYFCVLLKISQETAIIFLFRFNQLSKQHLFIVRKKLNLCIAYSSESKRIKDLVPDYYSADSYRSWKSETELWRI